MGGLNLIYSYREATLCTGCMNIAEAEIGNINDRSIAGNPPYDTFAVMNVLAMTGTLSVSSKAQYQVVAAFLGFYLVIVYCV